MHDTGAVYWLHQAIKGVDEKNGWVYFSSHKKRSVENHVYRAKLDGSTAAEPEELTEGARHPLALVLARRAPGSSTSTRTRRRRRR